MKVQSIVIALLAALALSGCSIVFGGGDTRDEEVEDLMEGQRSMLYGYIDMEAAEPDLDWVMLKRFEAGKGSEKLWMRVHEGKFYLENLKSGSYQIAEYGGIYRGAFCRGSFYCSYPVEYSVPRQLKMSRIKIEKPGLYFMGSSRVVIHESDSMFRGDTFSLEPEENPTNKEVLQGILPFMKSTKWEGIVQDALQTMK